MSGDHEISAVGALWRRTPAATWGAGTRGIQSGSDDQVIGPQTFDRIVRQYNFDGPLSRHMNPELEKTILAFEAAQNLNKMIPQEWVQWEAAARSALTITTVRFANYVGSPEGNRQLTRKVEISFKPDDLGLSPGAVDKLKQIAGRRYNERKNVVRLVAREMQSSAGNRERVIKQVAQLMYYSEELAKHDGTKAAAA